MIPQQPPSGTPCNVRWATPDGGAMQCPGVFIAFIPALDTEYRVLVRSKKPSGATTLVEVHPDSISFGEQPSCS